MNINPALLSSRATLMQYKQRIICILELGEDNIVRLYKKRNGELIFEAPVTDILFSFSPIVKSRMRFTAFAKGQEYGIRFGVWSIDVQKSLLFAKTKQEEPKKSAVRDVWVSTLIKYGAKEDPQQPEQKLGRLGIYIIVGCVVSVLAIIAFSLAMR